MTVRTLIGTTWKEEEEKKNHIGTGLKLERRCVGHDGGARAVSAAELQRSSGASGGASLERLHTAEQPQVRGVPRLELDSTGTDRTPAAAAVRRYTSSVCQSNTPVFGKVPSAHGTVMCIWTGAAG